MMSLTNRLFKVSLAAGVDRRCARVIACVRYGDRYSQMDSGCSHVRREQCQYCFDWQQMRSRYQTGHTAPPVALSYRIVSHRIACVIFRARLVIGAQVVDAARGKELAEEYNIAF